MPRLQEVLSSFRFSAYIPSTDSHITISQITPDIFTGALYFKRGHVVDRVTMYSLVAAATEKKMDVFMFQRNREGRTRKISLQWTDVRWFPIDLEATNDDISMELLALDGVVYSPAVDVERSELPGFLQENMTVKNSQLY